MQLQNILSGLRKADQDFGLIQPGDKIAVALSGGKDSMLLLLALSMYQKFPHTDFELVGIHVDAGFEDFDHALMHQFCREHNLKLHVEKTKIFTILQLEKNLHRGKIQCSLCSTLKKGVLFETAKKLGCNKVAFGHHADDAVETLFLNMIHGSKIAVFQPLQPMSRMEMDLIRPLCYVREKDIEEACRINEIPSVRRVCPNDGHTQRQQMKEELAALYTKYPMAYDNFVSALSNVDQVSLWEKNEKEE